MVLYDRIAQRYNMNPFDIPKLMSNTQIEVVATMMQEEGYLEEERRQEAEYKSQMSRYKGGINR